MEYILTIYLLRRGYSINFLVCVYVCSIQLKGKIQRKPLTLSQMFIKLCTLLWHGKRMNPIDQVNWLNIYKNIFEEKITLKHH